MCVSHLLDIMPAKQAAFFIAGVIILLTMNSPSVEANPMNSDRHFDDYTRVASTEGVYRFKQQSSQSEPFISRPLTNGIHSSCDFAFLIASVKVRFDDARPEESIAEENRGSGVSGSSTRRTITVTSTTADREENGPATPTGTTAAGTGTGNHVRGENNDHRSWTQWLSIIFVIGVLIVIWRAVRRPRFVDEQPERSNAQAQAFSKRSREKPPIYPLNIAIKLKSGGDQAPQQLNGLPLKPLFGPPNSKRLDQLIARARRNDPDYEPPDFSLWFEVQTPAGVNADDLAKALREFAQVETAYVMRVNVPPTIPEDDPRDRRQGYQNPAHDGIDARYAWGFLGGDGANVGFVDLEHGWNLNHRDLKDAKITMISGVNKWAFSHGTAVLGEVLMVDNTIGGVGIAPAAKGRVVSLWRTSLDPKTYDAIHDAAANMSFGDVLLLEVQEDNPASDSGEWPAEILELNYQAIDLATAAGIVVVEAAGNGNHDLDRYVNPSGKKTFNRNSPDFLDSGAIMVGAGSSVHPHTRLGFSNHGNRVDCYAWGENIVTATTSYTGKSNTEYTAHFDGTSGASAIVAGAALIVQGIAQAALGRRFSPRELRDLLKANGTPSATHDDRIGVMPDLRAIITNNHLDLVPVPTDA